MTPANATYVGFTGTADRRDLDVFREVVDRLPP